jgi:hypothetical protein
LPKAAFPAPISGKIGGMRMNARVTAAAALITPLFMDTVALAQSYQSDPYGNSGSGLSSGGLAPPGSGTGTSAGYDPRQSQSTQDALQQADSKDSRRGLEFVWLNAEAGVQTLSLETFHANNLVDAKTVATAQTGPLVGVGAGVRLVFLTLGGRFRLGSFSAWQLWTLNAELGLHLPIGKLEPYFTVAGGYASLGSFEGTSSAIDYKSAGMSIHGWNARLGFGLDYYFNHYFSIGALMTGDVLYLKRADPLRIPGAVDDPNLARLQQVYAHDGSSVGGAGTFTAVVGLHF